MARAIYLLIPLFLSGDEFVFWAKFISQNHLLAAQNIAVSRAMKNSGARDVFVCFIDAPKLESQSELEYLNSHKDELCDCFVSQEIKVLDVSRFDTSGTNSTTDVTYLPLRFRAEFTPSGAQIYAFEGKK